MLLAEVLGNVVASRKEPLMEGFKLMAVQPVDAERRPVGAPLVAVDSVGAGPGELVLLVAGSSARYTAVTTGKPADLTILGIVDTVVIDGRTLYDTTTATGRAPAVRSDPAGAPASPRPRKGGAGA